MTPTKRVLGLLVLFVFLPMSLNGQAAESSKTLTNRDVIDLLNAGLSTDVVLAKIKASPGSFETSPAALKELKAAGVSDSIIVAIVQARPALPSVDQILEKYVAALGGEPAIRKLTTYSVKGSVTIAGKGGTFEAHAKAPNKTSFAAQLTENASWKISEVYDGAMAWRNTPQTGTAALSGQELSVATRSADFFGELDLRRLYPKMTLKGEQKVGIHDSYVIEADPGDGSLRRMYFDSETGLLIRNDLETDTPQGRRIFSWYYDDFREVGGLKFAFSRKRPDPSGDIIYTATAVELNEPIDDSYFVKPGGLDLTKSSPPSTPSNVFKSVAYRIVPQQQTTYFQSGSNSSFTSCYGQGQFSSFGNVGTLNMNTNCNMTYTEPTQIPITWRYADVYLLLEASNQRYVVTCRATWRWSNCMPLIVGEFFQAEIAGGTLTVKATKNGKKDIHIKYNILQVAPTS